MERFRELLSIGRIKEKEAYDFLAPKLMTEKYENLDNVLYQFLKKRIGFTVNMNDFYELMENGSTIKWSEFVKKIKK